MQLLIAWIDRFTSALAGLLRWLMLLMVIDMLAVVVLRYAVGEGSIVLQESVLYLHAVAFMLGIPYALRENAHVRVDLLHARLGARGRALVDLIGHVLLLLPVSCALVLTSTSYVANAWRILEGSPEVGGIPAVFLLKTLIPVLGGCLALQGLAECGRCLLILRGAVPACVEPPAAGPEI
ncbi:MAG: TRAP transporter small permease subunit [Pseudomonadales bacterium]